MGLPGYINQCQNGVSSELHSCSVCVWARAHTFLAFPVRRHKQSFLSAKGGQEAMVSGEAWVLKVQLATPKRNKQQPFTLNLPHGSDEEANVHKQR